MVLLLLLPVEARAAREVSLEVCAKEVLDRPEELESYRCYWALSRRGQSDEAMRALEALLAIDPSNSKARLYLAAVEADLGLERAEATYREAAEGFASERNRTGETYAWISIGQLAYRDDRLQDAKESYERAARVAETADDPMLEVRVWVMSAMVARKTGNNARGLELLLKAESVAFPDGPEDIRSAILDGMGSAYWEQGLYEKARRTYLRQAELCAEYRMYYSEAAARFNVALLSQHLLLDNRMSEEEFLAAVQRARDLAIRAGNRSTEARTELLLGRVLGGKEGIERAERSLELARATGNRIGARESMRFLAILLWKHEPARIDEALGLLDDSIEDSRQTGNLKTQALGLIGRAELLSGSAERQVWIDAHREAIEAVEKIRDLQPDGTVGARLFSRWTLPYYRLAADLLERLTTSPDPEGDLDLALQVIERMRSRVLIDELDSARIPQRYDRDSPGPEASTRSVSRTGRERLRTRRAGTPRSVGGGRQGGALPNRPGLRDGTRAGRTANETDSGPARIGPGDHLVPDRTGIRGGLGQDLSPRIVGRRGDERSGVRVPYSRLDPDPGSGPGVPRILPPTRRLRGRPGGPVVR
jgi:tetratricopeptide (TPR) repeat protein